MRRTFTVRGSGQAREEDAASVYGCTGTLRANSAGTGVRPDPWLATMTAGVCGYRYTMSKQ